ncbi:hypothetical protein [Amorphus orientalis]|uniref:Uncharacterized protein n=1 Tax=Amorphus orientalis TaxID=649198 RepID=A0AAE3VS67_9HYPH|nr:hypothetical protein [Amorphus orientalis]MDQ0316671.1 hypothetical protein [Amorphus orientalis]
MGLAPLLALLLVWAVPVAGQDAGTAAEADAWLSVPQPVMIEHLTISKCEEPLGESFEGIDPVLGQLSGTATLYALPCTAGASRPTYRLYVHETGEIEGVHPTFVAVYTDEYGWQGTARVRAVEWDADAGRFLAEGPRDADGRIGSGVWSWGAFGLKLERFSLIDQSGNAELIYAAPE